MRCSSRAVILYALESLDQLPGSLVLSAGILPLLLLPLVKSITQVRQQQGLPVREFVDYRELFVHPPLLERNRVLCLPKQQPLPPVLSLQPEKQEVEVAEIFPADLEE